MMSDHKDSQDLLGQQALRVQSVALDLSDQLVRLALAAQTAWLDLWVLPGLRAIEDLQARQAQQARTARLVRRGIPAPLARQGLRVL
ncbi:hypothetical protein GCM10007884_31410 [Methylobacterium brachythecii]|uniref:Uncharacterized protein n=2 Tax=Methylobacterium brachythecii TaxID=1176177 RepID=A0ABQ6DAG3_9HYPH|nr:hypothetical protein GCM10007884_31410 [Methylobacterium brachythecii]